MKFLRFFSIHKSGKWYWKPEVCSHLDVVGKFKYVGMVDSSVCASHNISTDRYEVQHGLTPSCIQVFWLKFIFEVTIPFETKGYCKSEYVEVKPINHGVKQLCYKDNITPCDCNGLCKNSY